MEYPMQTESSTATEPTHISPHPRHLLNSMDENMRCFVKAAVNQEPCFVLRAQDISAPLAVLFWAKIQVKIRTYMDAGITMDQAVEAVRKYYFLDDMDRDAYTDLKLDGAVRIAEAMQTYPHKKLAD